MAVYLGSRCRRCRAEGLKLFLKGERCNSDRCAIVKKKGAPGAGPRARMRKRSDYGIQLREKQKVKRKYMMMEKQFHILFRRAEKMHGITGENLLSLLERRLDNVVYRMHFASSLKQARQVVLHGHVMVNGRKTNIPSYSVKEDDEIEISENSKKLMIVKESLKEYSRVGVAQWLEVDPDRVWGKIRALPQKHDIQDVTNINEQLIVELYSK